MTKDEALNIAIDYMNERLEEHDAKFQRHPVAEAERNNILADIEAVKEALAQPEPQYVAFMDVPQRTWVGLRDDEIYSVLENLQVMHHRPPTTDSRVIFAQDIEAKLKEKNT